ncbi:MAG: ATP-dependent DNA helicase [Cuniculiplasma sp.]
MTVDTTKGYAEQSYGTINLRKYQVDAINFTLECLMGGKTPIIESPTGSGKTVISIISSILYAKKTGKRVLYLTRTNSQQDQILKELRILSGPLDFRALALQGRSNLCPLYMEIEEESDFTLESLSKMCSSKKKRTKEKKEGGCYYYNGGISSDETGSYILKNMNSPEEIFETLRSRKICPYESLKFAMRDADLVVMPYANFVNSNMALTTLYNWRTSRENLVIIIDEAHNLPEIARQSNSLEITMNMINISEKEAVNFGDPEMQTGIHVSDFMETVRESLIELGRNLNENQGERRLMFREIFEEMSIYLKKSPQDVDYLVDALISFGAQVEDLKEEKGKVPMSHLKSLGEKLKFLQYAEYDRYICIISKKGEESVEAYCLDPSIVLEPLFKSASIHVSATLDPVWLYANMTGVQNYEFRSIRDVFPKSNLLVLYSGDLSTKYTEFNGEMVQAYADRIGDILSKNKRKTMVFFPSFNTMKLIGSKMQGTPHLIESQSMNQRDFQKLLNEYRETGLPILGVMGGRLSEGINMPGNLLEIEVIAGIPFPRPTIKQRALVSYYDMLYGSGWQYAFLFPAIIKVKQTMGRVIRTETDRGAVVLLDGRAEMLFPYIEAKLSADINHDLELFFKNNT